MKNDKYEIDLSIDTWYAKQAIKGLEGDFDAVSRSINKNLGNSIEGLIKGTKTLKQTLKEIAYDLATTQIKDFFTPEKKSGIGGVLSGISKFAGIFDSGGVIPGGFNQPVPIVAHGSEMILNPGQQANLFKMLNGQAKGGGGQPSYVYAPQIKTGASASEVFDVLNRHSRQFFSMVAEGVQTDSSLRNSVRGAR